MFAETLGMRLRGAYLSFHRRANAHFEPLGLTADQFVVLSIVVEEGGLVQREIADRAFSDPNTIGAILLKLKRKGLVRRGRHPDDARAFRIAATGRGRRLQRLREAGSKPLRRELEGLFSPQERRTLGKLLARIPAALRGTRRPPGDGDG